MEVSLEHFLYLSAFLFSLGLVLMISKRNIIVVLIGLELMLNAVNINLVAFGQYDRYLFEGQVFALFVIVIAVAESAVGLAILVQVYQKFKTANLDEINTMKK